MLVAIPKLAMCMDGEEANFPPSVPSKYAHLFRPGEAISGLPSVGGNGGRLLADSNASIDAIVAHIGTAKEHVYVLFYIGSSQTETA